MISLYILPRRSHQITQSHRAEKSWYLTRSAVDSQRRFPASDDWGSSREDSAAELGQPDPD
jgi:hypothetical protein